jgi:hypothetical protein
MKRVFFSSALAGGELSASRTGRFNHGERAPGTHWIGGWVSPTTGIDDVEKNRTGTLTPTPRPSSPYPVTIPTALSQLPLSYITSGYNKL